MVGPTLSVVPERDASGALEPRCAQGNGRSPGEPGPQPMAGERSLSSLLMQSDWTLHAVCATADPDALFVTGAAQRDAARICQACPVRLECLADALDNQVEFGVWGGMTERQRRAILKKSPTVTNWRSLLEVARASTTQEAAS